MSQYECEIKCPYCRAVTWQDVDEDCDHAEQQCDKCSKWFIFRIETTVKVYERQADCLNGAPHQLKESTGVKVIDGKVIGKNYCKVCSNYFELSEERKAEILKENV